MTNIYLYFFYYIQFYNGYQNNLEKVQIHTTQYFTNMRKSHRQKPTGGLARIDLVREARPTMGFQ